MFKEIEAKMDLPKVEEKILDFWDEDKTFEKSIDIRKNAPLYSFYDGPPFATGTPHYGHILQSITKDVVPRYWTMKGYKVPRKWGWDCHGLPIENIVEKELGYTHKKEILELGIEKFNAICRSKVMEYAGVWEKVIRRLGRWADMKDAYRTMDLPYMESVWWVFKELWDKGLIYESYRSMYICPRCETTLSQSEVSEGYKLVKDLSAIAKFELIDEPGIFVLAWTTTPWTLIGNVALAVGKDIDYVKVKYQEWTTNHRFSGIPFRMRDKTNHEVSNKSDEERKTKYYILAKELLQKVFKDQEFTIIKEFKGKDLIGKKYKPLFDYYANDSKLLNKENGWKIYSADFVTTDEGTGVVHIAPAFGEDDMELGKQYNLPFVQHVGMDGIIKNEAGHFAGMHVKDINDPQKTDIEIIKDLAHRGLLSSKEKFEHSYPHCWRCDTPLLNYATSSWFVSVTKIKEDALKLAKEINWSPKHIKDGRFGKWLEGARDWSISRQRFWASVIPIWKCEKCEETVVFGSVSELEKKSGKKVTDLHKDVVDKITFPCAKCKGEIKRVPDVLDTWFDSGSMPYAQLHYPFENAEKFEETFPADFIGEAQDQTRAWFYYLHILATAIKKKAAYKNVVVSGIILAEDGKKMSKKLQNYPDPMLMFDKYGADVVRFYILNSPVLQAENLNFSEKELAELSRGMFRMLWNSYSFFVLYANIDKWKPQTEGLKYSENLLDKWIVSELNSLIKNVNSAMENYELTKAVRLFSLFIDNLSNWYIRRSRKRFWKSENDSDKEQAYQTLFVVLTDIAQLMAPFAPFISEEIYKNLTGKESVHLADYPKSNEKLINKDLNNEMNVVRRIVELGLSARAEAKIKVRQPLQTLVYHSIQLNSELEEIIAEEVNVKEVKFVAGNANEVELDLNITDSLKMEGIARELIRNIQSLRKKSDFNVDDRISLFYQTSSESLGKAMESMKDTIAREVLAVSIQNQRAEAMGSEEFSIEGDKIWFGISKI